MRIIVRDSQGNSVSVNVSSRATVANVKRVLSGALGIESARQRLIFRGATLMDDKSLRDYEIQTGTILYLSVAEIPADAALAEEIVHSAPVQEILRRHSPLFTEPELIEFMEDYIALAGNPGLLAESGRLDDLFLGQLEMTQSGLADLAKHCADFEDAGLEPALLGGWSEPRELPTVIGERGSAPSVRPLPVAFGFEWEGPFMKPIAANREMQGTLQSEAARDSFV
jgi:hypothetical protein